MAMFSFKYKTFLSHRCCKATEVVSYSEALKQKQSKAERSFTVQCEPNPLIRMNHSLLEESYLNSGGSIDEEKQNRLFRDTELTCPNSKKWETIKIAHPDEIVTDTDVIARLSDNGTSLFAKYKATVIKRKLAKNFETPLKNGNDYCVSTFAVLVKTIYTEIN